MKKIELINQFTSLDKFERWRSMWKSKETVDIYSYIKASFHPEDALIFCRILFPDVVFYNGGYFLEMNFEEKKVLEWFNSMDGGRQEVEKIVNHIHVYDIFDGCQEDVRDDIFEQLAKIISFSWKIALQESFPGVIFSVEVFSSDKTYGPEITFYSQ